MEKDSNRIGNICLTLKEESRIRVGDDVEIYIKQVTGAGIGDAVRIVISAPVKKKIYRVKTDAGTSNS